MRQTGHLLKYGIISVVFFGAALLVLYKAAEMQLREIGKSAEEITQDNTGYRTFTLVARYQLIKERMLIDEEGQDYFKEAQIFLNLGKTLPEEFLAETRIFDRTILKLANLINYALGIEPLRRYDQNKRQRLIERAYLLELARDYEAAARYFGELKVTETGSRDYFSKIHTAFCLSLSGKRGEALRELSEIIENDSPKDLRVTATVLRALILELEQDYERIRRLPDSEFKAEKLFHNALYQKSVEIFSRLEVGQLSIRGRFFRGRALEEYGRIQDAVQEYRIVVQQGQGSYWQKLANRRILLLGAVHEADPTLISEARKNNAHIADDDFFDSIRNFARIGNQNRIKKKYLAMDADLKLWPGFSREKMTGLIQANYADLQEMNFPIKPMVPPATRKPSWVTARTPEERKKLLDTYRKLDKILTVGGDILVGIITQEKDNTITMQTVLGRLTIAADEVASREKIENQ